VEWLSGRAAAQRCGIDLRTVAKMLAFSVPPWYLPTRRFGSDRGGSFGVGLSADKYHAYLAARAQPTMNVRRTKPPLTTSSACRSSCSKMSRSGATTAFRCWNNGWQKLDLSSDSMAVLLPEGEGPAFFENRDQRLRSPARDYHVQTPQIDCTSLGPRLTSKWSRIESEPSPGGRL
jgi:hypothetical protein